MGVDTMSIDVGDLVFHERWDLCVWRVLRVFRDYSLVSGTEIEMADLTLEGGRAKPPDWSTHPTRVPTWVLTKAEQWLAEMELLAFVSLDCSPTEVGDRDPPAMYSE